MAKTNKKTEEQKPPLPTSRPATDFEKEEAETTDEEAKEEAEAETETTDEEEKAPRRISPVQEQAANACEFLGMALNSYLPSTPNDSEHAQKIYKWKDTLAEIENFITTHVAPKAQAE